MRAEQFSETVPLESWAVVNFAERQFNPQRLGEFLGQFVRFGGSNGIVIRLTQPPIVHGNVNDVEGCLRMAAKDAERRSNKPCQILICIINDFDKVYNRIKLASDSVLGIPSQCMQASKAARANPQYIANVQLKVNLKLGGKNFTVAPNGDPRGIFPLESKPYVIIGADVSHGPAMARGESRKPSVAAMVGTYDREGVKYAGVLRDQPGGTEIIQDFGGMFAQLVENFSNMNKGCRPFRLVVYRDGVSEGQSSRLSIASSCSSAALASASTPPSSPSSPLCRRRKDTTPSSSPPTTATPTSPATSPPAPSWIPSSATPRNSTSSSSARAASRAPPAPPTTRSSTTTTSSPPTSFRASPTASASTARATRSVGLVTPAYYAGLLADRGRAFIGGDDDSASETSSVSSGSGMGLPPVHPSLAANMFFV